MSIQFQCPTCRLALQQHQASQGYYCANKHHFDRHEQGYWVFNKPQRQKPTGDSRQQLRSKRFLLESGIFSPLLDSMAQMLIPLLSADRQLLDYECSDGYYLRELAARLADVAVAENIHCLGVSEAENAIFAAAKANTPATLCLASSKSLPFADNSIDFVTVIDRPIKGKESVRVLKKEGVLLLVQPGPRHLWQLKQCVYPELTEKPFQLNLPSELTLVETKTVRFTLSVTGEQALILLGMTPYAWRASDKIKHHIQSRQFTDLEIDFRLIKACQ